SLAGTRGSEPSHRGLPSPPGPDPPAPLFRAGVELPAGRGGRAADPGEGERDLEPGAPAVLRRVDAAGAGGGGPALQVPGPEPDAGAPLPGAPAGQPFAEDVPPLLPGEDVTQRRDPGRELRDDLREGDGEPEEGFRR